MTNNNQTGFLRLKEVLKLIPVGKTTWYNGIKSGIYPKPIRISKRLTAWKALDIYSFIESYGNECIGGNENEK